MTTRITSEREFIATRTETLYREQLDRVHDQANRVFFWLLLAQWAFAIVIAVVWSPLGWEGKVRSTNIHVPAAFLIGALINSLPLVLIKLRPRAEYTRHVVATAQMLWSALLIHLSGGRIETHFHVFGSLAFLAFYRDWRLFLTATIAVAGDHLLRGMLWPESVYGIASPEWWRFLEHAFWVVFEDVVLVMACFRATDEMRVIARGQAEVESQQSALVRTEKLAAIGELAASVGHELRNPLAAVKGTFDYLSARMTTVRPGEPVESDPRVKEFLALAERELGSCNRIITELLDFARDKRLSISPCPVRPLVAEVFALVPARAKVTLVNSVPDTMPVPSLDKEQFRRAIANLVQNASESFAEGVAGTVEVSASGGGAEPWVISVKDDGPGIPPDVLPKVFQPLFTTKSKGTGLGLAIVANLVERHGATIEVESSPGKGTRFWITLPSGVLGANVRAA